MSIEMQHYVVYFIVGFAVYKLFSPVLFWAFSKYKQWKNPNQKEDFYSCYTEVCSKCSIRKHE